MRLRIFLNSLITFVAFQNLMFAAPTIAQAIAAQNGLTSVLTAPVNNSVAAPGLAPASTLPPDQQLKQAVDVAKQGDAAKALAATQAAKSQVYATPQLSVEYVSTLLTIAENAKDDSVKQVLAEAATFVESQQATSNFDGRNNPESAYHFMVATGRLAEAMLPHDEGAVSRLHIVQGNISRNLQNNSAFPANAKESLAAPLIGMAKGHAIKQDQPEAMQAITEACNLGYAEFETLAKDPLLAKLPDQAAVKVHLKSLEKTYLAKVEKWSEKAIDEFQSFGYNFHVDDVDGGSLANRNFEDKILVVDFWATWCPPCREEIPHFVQLQKDFADEDVQVLGISMDSPDDPNSSKKTVLNFLKKNQVNYPCGLGTEQLTQAIPGDVKLPTTLFIDRDGNVRYIATGYHDHAKLAAITKALTRETQPVRTTINRLRTSFGPH